MYPGAILKDEIKALGLIKKDLAKDVGITMLSDMIHGRRNITADLALKLEGALNISAMFWMNSQIKYDLDNA